MLQRKGEMVFMKKIHVLCFLLLFVYLFSFLYGCKKEETNNDKKDKVTVTFVLNQEKLGKDVRQVFAVGESIKKEDVPSTPKVGNYYFNCWTSDEAGLLPCNPIGYKVDKDITFYANWYDNTISYTSDVTMLEANYGGVYRLPQDKVIFYGSSNFSSWVSLEREMAPELDVLNHGLGDTTDFILTQHIKRMVLRYSPKAVVIQCSHIEASRFIDDQITSEKAELYDQIHNALPDTKIIFVSYIPLPTSAVYWRTSTRLQELNQWMKEFCEERENCEFIDVFDDVKKMSDAYYKGERASFLDASHFSHEGYKQFAAVLKPAVLNLLEGGDAIEDKPINNKDKITVNNQDKDVVNDKDKDKDMSSDKDTKIKWNDPGDETNLDWKKDQTLKVLSIGNSFSVDAQEYLYDIAKDMGVKKIKLGNLYIGGCTLATHLDNAQKNKKIYTYYTNEKGFWNESVGYSISDAVKSENWDYITFQQQSTTFGMKDSLKDLQPLMDIVSELCPDAKLVWHMSWAYQSDSTQTGFIQNFNGNQDAMYKAIVTDVKTQVETNNSIDLIIPNGTAIQNARTSSLGDTLTRDGYHLSHGVGRYIAALTFARTLTGISVDELSYMPPGVDQKLQNIAIESVLNAINNPYEVTKSKVETKNK